MRYTISLFILLLFIRCLLVQLANAMAGYSRLFTEYVARRANKPISIYIHLFSQPVCLATPRSHTFRSPPHPPAAPPHPPASPPRSRCTRPRVPEANRDKACGTASPRRIYRPCPRRYSCVHQPHKLPELFLDK